MILVIVAFDRRISCFLYFQGQKYNFPFDSQDLPSNNHEGQVQDLIPYAAI